MNVNLIQARDYDSIPVSAHLDDNKATLITAGVSVVGGPVLMPADQDEYPGAFEVWWIVWHNEGENGGSYQFAWVNYDGVVEYVDFLPEADTFDLPARRYDD